MTSFKGSVLLLAVGLVLIHTATCQTAATVTDSTVVWAAQTEAIERVTPGEAPVEAPTTTAATVADTTTTAAAEGMPLETTAAPTTIPPPTAPVTTAPINQNQNQPIDQGALNPVASQQLTPTGTAPATAPAAASQPTDAGIQADVTQTVLALLNETGYSGSVNDANVQEIVRMLMNGTVPTDADLMRLGIIPTHAPGTSTAPPPYNIPGPTQANAAINFQPLNPAPTLAPTLDLGAPAQPSTGANSIPQLSGGNIFPPNIFSALLPPTTPKPFEPFAQSNIGNPLPPNSIAPKPSSPVDLLNSLSFPASGTPGGMLPPPSGILDTQYQQQQQQQRQQGMNPMMMMMMLVPEMAEAMMSGENPMLTMMLMQSMQQSHKPQTPANPQMGSSFGPGAGGFPSTGAGPGGFMDPGFGGMPGAGTGLDLSSLTGANTGPGAMGGSGAAPPNLMPFLNMINQPTGSPAPSGMPLPGSGAPPTDMSSLLGMFGTPPTGGAGPTAAAGPTDMSLAGMLGAGTAPTGVSPTLDPFVAMG